MEAKTSEVPGGWGLANGTPIYKKGCKEDNKMVSPSQQKFMKTKSCLTNLVSFYDEVTHLMDEAKAVNVIYLAFSQAFDTVSHSLLHEFCWLKGQVH